MSKSFIFTSESVSEGHPDKVCDFISDSILDAHLAQDPNARVACETLAKHDTVVLAGEITSRAEVDHEAMAREAIRAVGYDDATEAFNADGVRILSLISRQAAEIDTAVSRGEGERHDQGAGDQGIMFGYATSETPELMPLPIVLAHALGRALAEHRRKGTVDWLRPDAKTQVSVRYVDGRPAEITSVLVSTMHRSSVTRKEIEAFITSTVLPEVLGAWYTPSIGVLVNPSGSFTEGGPSADCGLTGRKIIVDTYGGMARHGGGAFSGKDPSKVDRSAAYFCRHVARSLVREGLAERVEVQVAYAIGVAEPMSVKVDTFGTGDELAAEEAVRRMDFRPASIIDTLNLLRPIYRQTTNYGHFGKVGLPWEA